MHPNPNEALMQFRARKCLVNRVFIDDFKKYVENPENIGLIKIIKNKYPHLSRAPRITKRTKKLDVKAYVFEMLESHLYKDSVQYKFTRE